MLASGELDALDRFWRRFNGTVIETSLLQRRRSQLVDENAALRQMLQQCMEANGDVAPAAGAKHASRHVPMLEVHGIATASECRGLA